MGTNYYAESAPCEHCGRSDARTHIGKSLSMFRGYSTDWPSPWGPIRSVNDWHRVVTVNNLTIVDEYGATHPAVEFFTRVRAVPRHARRRQYDWMEAHHPGRHEDYLDDEGFSFCDREFS